MVKCPILPHPVNSSSRRALDSLQLYRQDSWAYNSCSQTKEALLLCTVYIHGQRGLGLAFIVFTPELIPPWYFYFDINSSIMLLWPSISCETVEWNFTPNLTVSININQLTGLTHILGRCSSFTFLLWNKIFAFIFFNRPLPSGLEPHYESDAKCRAFHMTIDLCLSAGRF